MNTYEMTQRHKQGPFLFIDTETTGFPKKGPVVQEGQARVCQLAMLLTDCEGKSLTEFSSLIRPDGWSISAGAANVHGFTDTLCETYGISNLATLSLFIKLQGMAGLVVAHNESFDSQMMDIEVGYSDFPPPPIKTPWFCTMKSNTHITGGKWPKLEEALKHYCGRELGDFAHDAMYDVKACRDIFFAMRKQQEQAA